MRCAVEPVAEGTKLTLSSEVFGSGWMKPFEPLLQRNVHGIFERAVLRSKALIEAELAS